jgi:hypothetical protein
MENTNQTTEIKIKWYHYLAAFFAGVFLANFIPHFVHGVSGLSFPTIFSSFNREKSSPPPFNIFYACLNLLLGYILLRVSKTSSKNKLLLFFLFLGVLAIGTLLSFIIKGTA